MTGTLLNLDLEVLRASWRESTEAPDDPGPERPWVPPDPALARSVRTIAVAVLGRTLEVLDGRRPRIQLSGAVTEAVFGQITVLLQHGAFGQQSNGHQSNGPDGCARLHRVHVQFRSVAAAEVFGTLECGNRVRALAGRLERRRVRVSAPGALPRRVADRWVLTEFTIL
ncbi:MAG: Rv3235 family protein [Gordonia sp. (in: high G+C Gram-positive bacteria)]|uniref:Rv3235 family protein n=1 Tax=Gordonia sp. (in: high G+C Gram-positive bacteria) TaxID=84139 RepID=UPI003BB7864E